MSGANWGQSNWGEFNWGEPGTGLSVTINEAKQRTVVTGEGCKKTEKLDGSFLVDISFTVTHAGTADVTLTAEYSIDGGNTFNTASPQDTDFKHDADNPLTTSVSGISYTFVWNAFFDLSENDFTDVLFRLTITDSGAQTDNDTSDPFDVTTLISDVVEDAFSQSKNRRAQIESTPFDFLGCGLVTPFRRSSRDFKQACGVQVVRSCVRQILNTKATSGNRIGELPWRPEFGSTLYNFRYRGITLTLPSEIEAAIIEALDQEPRVLYKDVSVEEIDDNTLLVSVRYDIINENVAGNNVILPDVTERITL